MWALVVPNPGSVVLQRVAVPSLDANSVLIRVEYSGVSAGTERLAALGRISHFGEMPFVAGYQCSGRVVAVGQEVTTFAPGDHAVAHCYGTHAEYAKADPEYVHRIDETANATTASLFVQFAVAANAVNQAAINAGDSVLVIGQGLVGQATALLARLRGAFVIASDLDSERIRAAHRVADWVIDASTVSPADAIHTRYADGVDVVIESTGVVGVLDDAFACLRKYGTFVFEGFYPRNFGFTFKNAHDRHAHAVFPSSVGSRAVREAVLRLIGTGCLEVEVQRVPWQDATSAYSQLLAPSGVAPSAIVIDWSNGSDVIETKTSAQANQATTRESSGT